MDWKMDVFRLSLYRLNSFIVKSTKLKMAKGISHVILQLIQNKQKERTAQ